VTTKTTSEIVIYEGDNARVEVRLDRESVWLTQEQVGLLFGRERSVITKHIRNVFAEGELDEKSNVQNLHIAGSDKPVKFYNLDVIISVGYRVKSIQGEIWRQSRFFPGHWPRARGVVAGSRLIGSMFTLCSFF